MNRAITDQLVSSIAAALRSRGFSRRGLLFQRSVGDILHLVQLQKSQSSSAQHIKATINLAVWVPAISPATSPHIDAHVRRRIGSLMPETGDVWWEIHSLESANETIPRITHALDAFGIAWLDTLQSAADVVRMWQSGVSPGITEAQRQRFLTYFSSHEQSPNVA